MSARWTVYWDRIDRVWRSEPGSWADMGRAVVEGHRTWREAFDHAFRMARAAR